MHRPTTSHPIRTALHLPHLPPPLPPIQETQHSRQLPWRAIGARVYALNRLNEALADAEAMRLPKAVVDPQLRA